MSKPRVTMRSSPFSAAAASGRAQRAAAAARAAVFTILAFDAFSDTVCFLELAKQGAPILGLRNARLPLAEELGDELAVGVEELDRVHVAVDRGLGHAPGLGHAVGAKVQVEAVVQHVDPGAERFDVLHGPRV